MSRYHLAIEAIKRAEHAGDHADAPALIPELHTLIAQATQYSREHFEDAPEISKWTWPFA